VRRAVQVIAVSQCTRDDLVRVLGADVERITVVPEGIDPRFKPRPVDEVEAFRARHGLPQRFLLWVGLRRPHKNVARLVQAYARYRERAGGTAAALVLWGMPDRRDAEADEIIRSHRLEDVVRIPDRRLPDADMPLLYNAATAFVLPSLYEGFGLPPLEAAACGVPVLATSAGALPEVLGDAALFVVAEDTSQLAAGIERILTDAALRDALRERGLARAALYPWSCTARGVRAVYDRLPELGPSGRVA
jgi:alpha-1,3-rhamnosyl/mannosyltransferase